MAKLSICSIPDCGKQVKHRGWCGAHYQRWTKYGDPLGGGPHRIRRGNTCSIDGCEKPVAALGWCMLHYKRWRRHGDVFGGSTFQGEPEKYLNEVVLQYEGDDCLNWPFCRASSGYGLIKRNGKYERVHRLVCEHAHGASPSEQSAAHNCGKGHLGCVAPKHIRWDTHAGNMADTAIHGTSKRGELKWCAKLTEKDVREIRKLAEFGPSINEIAKTFGVAYSTVHRIAHRQAWGWLE